MALIRRPRDGALLVASAPSEDFERPLGGHVEFGELAEATVRREFLEELGQELGAVRLLGVIENLYADGTTTVHEIVFLFEAAFVDPAAYEIADQGIRDHPTGEVRVTWKRPGESGVRLVPEAIARYI